METLLEKLEQEATTGKVIVDLDTEVCASSQCCVVLCADACACCQALVMISTTSNQGHGMPFACVLTAICLIDCSRDAKLTSLLLSSSCACQNVHTVAGVLKRALIKLEPCLVPEKTFDQLLECITLPPLQVITLESHEERSRPLLPMPSASRRSDCARGPGVLAVGNARPHHAVIDLMRARAAMSRWWR
jgi:hypothetical protein